MPALRICQKCGRQYRITSRINANECAVCGAFEVAAIAKDHRARMIDERRCTACGMRFSTIADYPADGRKCHPCINREAGLAIR